MHVSAVPNVAAEPVQYVIDTSVGSLALTCVRIAWLGYVISKVIADNHLVPATGNPQVESPRVNGACASFSCCGPEARKRLSSRPRPLARLPSRRTNRRRAHHRARTPVRNYCQRSSTLPRGHRCLEHSPYLTPLHTVILFPRPPLPHKPAACSPPALHGERLNKAAMISHFPPRQLPRQQAAAYGPCPVMPTTPPLSLAHLPQPT